MPRQTPLARDPLVWALAGLLLLAAGMPQLKPLFEQWAPTFQPIYDDGQQWAVLEFDQARR